MKKLAPFLIGLLLLIGINYAIWNNEKILQEGETIFLELVPVDPRSLMQGDYMRLAFAIEREISKEKDKTKQSQSKSGRLIIQTNDQGIAHYIDVYQDQPLKQSQKTIRYTKSNRWNRRINIQPRSYFFQEGHRSIYQNAKYGVFKYKGPHSYLLFALADKNQTIIKPPKP